jgi:outer membrane lipoprotein-sorting protein
MGSEMQPKVMRAQKREIQISHVKKNLKFSAKKFTFSMELEVFLTIIQKTYS